MSTPSYLSNKRTYRGSDESVEIIGDRSTLINILQNPENHSRQEIVKEILSSYSGKTYGDSNWSLFTGGWTTPKVPTVYAEFREQFDHLSQLSFSPSFVVHLPEFYEFSKRYSTDKKFEAVRDEFKDFLGYRVVYRGMNLNEKELNNIKTEGIDSLFFENKKHDLLSIEHFEAHALSTNFGLLVEHHFHGEDYNSPLVSVSSYEDVAIAVGRHFGRGSRDGDKKEFYLFKLRVPEIDLIYYTDPFIRAPSKLKDMIDRGCRLHISVDEQKNTYPWGRHVESYVMYKIDSSEILEISKPNVQVTSWNGKVCTKHD